MPLLVKDSPQGKKCLPPLEKSAYRGEKKLLTVQRKKSLPRGEKTAYRVVVKTPYHPHLLKVNYPMNDESTLRDAGCFFYG